MPRPGSAVIYHGRLVGPNGQVYQCEHNHRTQTAAVTCANSSSTRRMAQMAWTQAAARAARAEALARRLEAEQAAAHARRLAAQQQEAARRAAARAAAEEAKAARRAAKLAAMPPRRAWKRMTPEERLLRTAEAEMQVYGKVLSAEARPAYEARAVKSRAGTQETEVPPIAPANVRAVQDRSDATPRAGESPATRRALSNDDEREADTQVVYVPETRRRVAHGDTAGQDDPGTGAVGPSAAQPRLGGDGLFVVGLEIMPGVYRTPGPAGSRDGSVALLRSTSTRDVMDFNMVQGPFTITVGPGVKAVKTSRCQPWHRLGDTLEAAVAGVPRPTSPRRT